MTKREQIEARQEELKKQMEANKKLLKQMERAERAEAEKKAREEESRKALEFYRHCMKHDINRNDGTKFRLYDYVMGIPSDRLTPHEA